MTQGCFSQRKALHLRSHRGLGRTAWWAAAHGWASWATRACGARPLPCPHPLRSPRQSTKFRRELSARPEGGQGRGRRYHDEALRQARAGQEVDNAQPLGEPQVSERGRLQRDGVGCGRPHSQLPLEACWPPHRLSWGQAGFRGQPLVQVRQLWRHSGQRPRPLRRGSPRGATAPAPGLYLSPRDPPAQPGLGRKAGQGFAHSYLHPTNVDGQDSGEEQHLKEEVRHQTHDGKETELLRLERTRGCHDHRAPHPRAAVPWLQAPQHLRGGWWQAGRSREGRLVLNLGTAKQGQHQQLPSSPPGGSRDPPTPRPPSRPGGECSPQVGKLSPTSLRPDRPFLPLSPWPAVQWTTTSPGPRPDPISGVSGSWPTPQWTHEGGERGQEKLNSVLKLKKVKPLLPKLYRWTRFVQSHALSPPPPPPHHRGFDDGHDGTVARPKPRQL